MQIEGKSDCKYAHLPRGAKGREKKSPEGLATLTNQRFPTGKKNMLINWKFIVKLFQNNTPVLDLIGVCSVYLIAGRQRRKIEEKNVLFLHACAR